MSENVLVSDLTHKIPTSLSIKDRYDSGILGKTVRSVACHPSIFSPTGISVINIPIPPIGWVNFEHSYIRGELAFTQGLALSNSIHSVVRRLVVRGQNGVVIVDTDGYNLLSDVIQDYSVSVEESTRALAITTLSGDSNQRKSYWSGRQFCFQPLCDILRSSLLPVHLMGGLNIELHLDSVNTAFIDDNVTPVANPSYAVSNVRYVLEVDTMSETNEKLAREAFMAGRLKYHFSNWRMQPSQSDSPNYDLTLQSENSTKGIVVCPRRVAYLNAINQNSFGRIHGGMQQVQWGLGSNLFDTFDCTKGAAQLFQEAQKMFHMTQNINFEPEDFWNPDPNTDASAYIVALNAESIPAENRFVSGYTGKGQINVNIRYVGTVLPVSYFSYILYDTRMEVSDSNGVQLFT